MYVPLKPARKRASVLGAEKYVSSIRSSLWLVRRDLTTVTNEDRFLMESQAVDSINKTARFRLTTPHKEILPIRHVMERSPLLVRIVTVPNASLWPVPSGSK